MAVKKVKLAELIEDWDLYPRQTFSSQWVLDLVDRLEEGATLPPPVIDRKGMRIVDGWHRVKALRKFLGSGAEIDADVRTYKSDADAVKDAVQLNDPEGRGLPLDRASRDRAVVLLERHGVTVQEISGIVRMPEQKVRVILLPPRQKPETSEQARDLAEKARENAARGQAAAGQAAPGGGGPAGSAESSRGWWIAASCRALIQALEKGDVTSASDQRSVGALWELHDAVDAQLERPEAAA
jgi:hypothetical protein